jgi:hypothetical protein
VTNEIRLYVPLLNEGTDVLRPTTGVVLDSGVVCICATHDYNPEFETWAFLPGSKVRCVSECRGGREILVARQRVA